MVFYDTSKSKSWNLLQTALSHLKLAKASTQLINLISSIVVNPRLPNQKEINKLWKKIKKKLYEGLRQSSKKKNAPTAPHTQRLSFNPTPMVTRARPVVDDLTFSGADFAQVQEPHNLHNRSTSSLYIQGNTRLELVRQAAIHYQWLHQNSTNCLRTRLEQLRRSVVTF